jgi:hypothetical protein
MNKLFTFGCSFTAGNGCLIDESYTNQYKSKDTDLIWNTIIANEIGYELVNYGMGGYSNDKIFDTILEVYNSINQNDYVIIEMSFHHRYDIPNKLDNSLITIAPNPSNLLVNEYSKSEIEHISYVSTLMESNLFKKRNVNRFNFLQKLLLQNKKVKNCLIWDVEENINNFEKIVDATGGEINDHHWSFEGHRNFAKHLLNTNFYRKLV